MTDFDAQTLVYSAYADRKHLDILTRLFSMMAYEFTSTHSLVLYDLKKSRMWMGQLLSDIGEQNPYAANDGKRNTSEDIIPPVDTVTEKELTEYKLSIKWHEKNSVQRLDFLRQTLRPFINRWATVEEIYSISRSVDQIVIRINEVVMGMGLLLSELR